MAATSYPRFLEARLLESVADTPATLIHGPRQCGKTTFVKAFAAAHNYRYVTFDDNDQVQAALDDPIGYVDRLGTLVVLDEVQRVPHLFTTLKAAIDNDRTPGRYVMTGSANVLMVPTLADSLAGRLGTLRMYPLAQSEIRGTTPQFLHQLFTGAFTPQPAERLGLDLVARVARGGYPEALARSPHRAAEFLRDHIDTQIQRDVRSLAQVRSLKTTPAILRQVAAYTAELANVSRLASDVGVKRETVDEHLALLEHIFVIDRLPAWSRSEAKRAAKTPKLHIADTGMGAALLERDVEDLSSDRTYFGHLLESFVLAELRAQASWHERRTSFHHFRDANQNEVDIVLERGPNRIAGIEVKAASVVGPKDFRGLRKLRDITGDSFKGGAVLYDGTVGYRHDDNLWALPISMLWGASE